MKPLYLDFEYRDNKDRDAIILCTTKLAREPSLAWDLRTEEGLTQFKSYCESNTHNIWTSYNLDAELQCLISLGINFDSVSVVDLMAEATMIMRTKEKYFSQKSSLLTALDKFGIESLVDEQYKDVCRDIILGNTRYTNSQWDLIVEYGLSDVDLLPDLWKVIRKVHLHYKSYKTEQEYIKGALSRGEYVKAASVLYRRSKGYPINEPLLNTVFEHREKIKALLCQSVNDEVDKPIYTWNKPKHAYSLNNKVLEEVLQADRTIEIIRTETGMVSTKTESLDKMIKGHPKLDKLYRVAQTLQVLSSRDLRELNQNGYIKAGYRTFNQDTGRTSPKPKEGFLLNLTPWMRYLIHPHPGEVLIGIDWSQQEMYIGAVLSKDSKMMEAYLSGDIYLHLAKMAGAVPPEGTKKSHPTERQNFKAVQLGIGYGKGIDALSVDIFNGNFKEGISTISMEEAERVAKNIMGWHKRTFSKYWNWVNDHITNSKNKKFYKTSDGSWVRFCAFDTAATKLKNLPFQSGGAALLRQAVKLVHQDGTLDMVCSLHDAIYILSTEDKWEEDQAKLIGLMNQACSDVYGEMSTFYNDEEILVNLDAKQFTHETGYVDERGSAMLQEVLKLLEEVKTIEEIEPREFELPPKKLTLAQLKKNMKAATINSAFAV